MTEQWRVGDVTVTKMVEFLMETPDTFLLPGADEKLCKAAGDWIKPYVSERWYLVMSVHMLVVDIGEHRLAIDTCVGNCKKRHVKDWNDRRSEFLEELIKAGFPPETFTHVVMTHMHGDHVGWNTVKRDGKWVPTFPNARYIMVDKELQHWKQEYPVPEELELFVDSIQPIIDNAQLDLVPHDHTIVNTPQGVLKYTPTTGHTPGHASVIITSGDAKAFITGDAFHHPIQIRNPVITSKRVDSDSAEAIATRERLLPYLADSEMLVLGTHFSTPSGGFVRRTEEGYVFVPCAEGGGKP
eukprot:TRINITY_DN3167_c1_g2_i1.p1 TRINITY_DN3167_c1_g2~~TRINITY_DN3167_c1_g2_i1.p1  ORF type:complete len:298 (+),score=121.25 TRINITY_DN3167_c1_g2_i1:43-936(+)